MSCAREEMVLELLKRVLTSVVGLFSILASIQTQVQMASSEVSTSTTWSNLGQDGTWGRDREGSPVPRLEARQASPVGKRRLVAHAEDGKYAKLFENSFKTQAGIP